METTYRKLTPAEIAILQANGCRADDWSRIEAVEDFTADNIKNCRFGGTVRLGKNVTIDGVREGIENYEIGDNAFIFNVESLIASGESTFGGGTRVAVLNEAGGREVPIYNGLTAQIACLSALYRHRPEAVQAIERLIEAEIATNGPKLGRIGAGSYIAHCGTLRDVYAGENADFQGVAELTNGTVGSTADSPTRIGRGVIARDFIIADGARVTDNALIERCFVGQGCRIGKGFTAQDSLFFANCECEQGEATAVFAGPYTISHHKSTLLIGLMCSFYNAGSGTNMSNHMYRLGPVHQGVTERGVKTGSGAYLLFPTHVGAFSVVLGHHDGHPDTRHLPFSYLIEREGKTVVLPGQLLKSIGLARDRHKWPERDRRKGTKRDLIVFDGLNPCTIEQILNGLNSPEAGRGKEIYQTAVNAWLGDAVLRRLKSGQPLILSTVYHKNWCDLAGLIAPTAEVEHLLELLPSMHSIHELSAALTGLYDHYEEWAWGYAASLIPSGDWVDTLRKGMAAAEKMLEWQLADALKEYAPAMQIGYANEAEFEAIHGSPADHPFLNTLKQELQDKKVLADKVQKPR